MGRRGDNRLTDIAAIIKHQTDKAFLLHDGAREEWVPKDLVEDNKDGTFTMPEWLAQEKGFI
jgi:hypothetical protein